MIRRFLLGMILVVFSCYTCMVQAVVCPGDPDVCQYVMCGGQSQDSTAEKVIAKLKMAYEETTKFISETKAFIQNTIDEVVSLPATAMAAVSDGISAVTAKAMEAAGLAKTVQTQNQYEDTQSVTQYNERGSNIQIGERLTQGLERYKGEVSAVQEAKDYTDARRKYIRQRSTINLLARVQVVKASLKDIKNVMDNMENHIKSEEQKAISSGSPNEMLLRNTHNKLRVAYFQLMSMRKQLEAAKLEFLANQKISSMPKVKVVPEVTPSKNSSKK